MTHKFAKYFILAIGALGLSALPALADSACSTYTTVAQLESAGSCSVTANGVTLDFSGFTYTPGGSDAIASSAVGVTEVSSPDGPGLSFNPAIADTDGESTDVSVGFTVTDDTPGSLLSDVYIDLTAPYAIGTGSSVVYTETICSGGESECILYTEEPTGPGTDLISLIGNSAFPTGPVSSLTITKDLDVSAGATGFAGDSGFENEYSTVPEPRAISLVLGLGLLAGLAIFKRRQVAQS